MICVMLGMRAKRRSAGPIRHSAQSEAVRSPQTLSEVDRRAVAGWAADCADRVLPIFEAAAPGDDRPRQSIMRTRAFARGELAVAEEIRRRFIANDVARTV